MSFGGAGPATATGTGSVVAVTGSIIAQTSGADVGNAALIVAMGGLLTGVLGGITQLVKIWLDGKSYSERLKVSEERGQKLEADLKMTREKRHADANRLNAVTLELQVEKIRTARLEGQLGVIDKSHAVAINDNAINTKALADQTGMVLPSPVPHVDPISSGDDLDPFFLP